MQHDLQRHYFALGPRSIFFARRPRASFHRSLPVHFHRPGTSENENPVEKLLANESARRSTSQGFRRNPIGKFTRKLRDCDEASVAMKRDAPRIFTWTHTRQKNVYSVYLCGGLVYRSLKQDDDDRPTEKRRRPFDAEKRWRIFYHSRAERRPDGSRQLSNVELNEFSGTLKNGSFVA